MLTYIDVVTGFLESGKTTFVNEIIKSKVFEEYEETVLILCEEGPVEYEDEILKAHNVDILILEDESELTDDLFKNICNKYDPDYIIVEYNGTWNITKILSLKMPFNLKFRNVISISEASTFQNQLCNMASVMQPHILNSDVVVFNRYEKIDESARKKLQKDVENINSKTKIFFLEEFKNDKKLKTYFQPFEEHGKIGLNLKTAIFIALCSFVIPVLAFHNLYTSIQSISTVFLSILMEAIPFILFGAFISAVIQIFVSTGWIMKKFSEGKLLSFLVASIAGFFIPVCDCGMVPIVSGLLKKNTPLPQTITFWLASSSVNPIVILSILYAFPGQPNLVIIRVVAGVLIGIIVGIILKILNIKTKDVIKETHRYQNIGKDILELKYEGTVGKIEAVFQGAKIEFFRVAEYVIIGALVSSVLQTVMPQTMKNFIGGNIIIQFMVMVVAAMLMSTCSTSNAFIGKSFSSNFGVMSIMSFIVLGPMLDFKNMIMLSEILKRRFLVILACMVIVVGALVFGIIGIFL